MISMTLTVFALLGEPLHGVQMGEDAAVVDRAGRRHHARTP